MGCAVDNGFRYAIAHGVTLLARTAADCLPHPGWTRCPRCPTAGRGPGVRAHRRAPGRARAARAGRLPRLVRIAALFGRIRPAHRRRHGYLAPYRMHAGNNMAITSELYEAVGGMPRRPSPTDRLFLNRVRRHTTAIVHARGMAVENSTRRLRAYGLIGTARWYLGQGPGRHGEDPR